MLIDLKGKAQAEAWAGKVEELNNQTNQVMKCVSACLEEIKGESVGDMVDELVVTGAGVLVAADAMLTAINDLVGAVRSSIAAFAQSILEAVALVQGDREKTTTF